MSYNKIGQIEKNIRLDLEPTSIGWALVDSEEQRILGMGSRIIPMDQGVLDTFSGGNPVETQTAARTVYRGTRPIARKSIITS